jgi:hypothetical protein
MGAVGIKTNTENKILFVPRFNQNDLVLGEDFYIPLLLDLSLYAKISMSIDILNVMWDKSVIQGGFKYRD